MVLITWKKEDNKFKPKISWTIDYIVLEEEIEYWINESYRTGWSLYGAENHREWARRMAREKIKELNELIK